MIPVNVCNMARKNGITVRLSLQNVFKAIKLEIHRRIGGRGVMTDVDLEKRLATRVDMKTRD